MENVLIAICVLAIVALVVLGICFLAIFGYKIKALMSKEKIEVTSKPDSDFPKNN